MCLGGIIKGIAGNKAAKRADRATADAIRRQGEFRREQSERLAQRIAELQQSDPTAERAQAEGRFLDSLSRNRRTAQARFLAQQGQGPEAFDDFGQRATSQQDALSGQLASLFAQIDAPAFQRQREGIGTADLGQSLEEIARRARRRSNIDNIRISGIQANPLLLLLGDAVEGAQNAAQRSGS